MVSTTRVSFSIAVAACLQSQCTSFVPQSVKQRHKLVVDPTHVSTSVQLLAAATPSPPSNGIDTSSPEPDCQLRRSILTSSLVATFGIASCFDENNVAIAADGKLDEILDQVKEAREQLESVPDLIKDEKWDSGK